MNKLISSSIFWIIFLFMINTYPSVSANEALNNGNFMDFGNIAINIPGLPSTSDITPIRIDEWNIFPTIAPIFWVQPMWYTFINNADHQFDTRSIITNIQEIFDGKNSFIKTIKDITKYDDGISSSINIDTTNEFPLLNIPKDTPVGEYSFNMNVCTERIITEDLTDELPVPIIIIPEPAKDEEY